MMNGYYERVNVMTEKNDELDSEYMETLNRICQQRRHLPDIKYFLDTEYAWAINKAKPSVAILGTDIPEELVYACGTVPYHIIGGSRASTAWSDELVPRDTDPVSRSILGFIHRPDADFSDTLFIIPLVSDSMRKTAYQLKTEGRKICLVDIPPNRSDGSSIEKYQRQIIYMTKAVSEHTQCRITKSDVISAAGRLSGARLALTAFLNASCGRPDIISDEARLMIGDSFYRTNNIGEWTYRLQILTDKVIKLKSRYAYVALDRPNVLVMGSPVIFPNYKIPKLINEAGMNVSDIADSSALKRYLIYGKSCIRGSRDRIIKNIASIWYQKNASPTFVRNDTMRSYISWLIGKRDIDGVVYHVLKGQIEHDFELGYFETMLSEHGIPLFRLETDYQYQDTEQLRIRLEAFSEMLTHKRYSEVRQAK